MSFSDYGSRPGDEKTGQLEGNPAIPAQYLKKKPLPGRLLDGLGVSTDR
jgi:hypothetical protein